MRKTLKLLLALSLIAAPALADKYTGEFLSFGMGGRALGLGGAYVSIADDGFSSYWNPAATALSSHQMIFNHSSNFDGLLTYDALGYSRPIKNGGIGLIFVRLSIKDIPYTNNALLDLNSNGVMDPGERLDYDLITDIQDAESALFLNYSRMYRQDVFWGANLKLVNKSLGSNSAWGIGLDAGVLSRLPHDLRLGLNLQDITTTYLAWDTGKKEVISPAARLGLSWNPNFAGNKALTISAGFDVRFERRRAASQYYLGNLSADSHYGLEYVLKQRLALRLGSDLGRLAAGAGLKLGRFNFDYAYLGSQDLGNSTRLSASLNF
ncbi:PorV/PorQ family protein [candidate division TA06 bacterium]|nr:PorV/PorQ family protein [candidate division TA06 bacterium]